jgi:hypothetical protein
MEEGLTIFVDDIEEGSSLIQRSSLVSVEVLQIEQLKFILISHNLNFFGGLHGAFSQVSALIVK